MMIDENGLTVIRAEDLPALRSWIAGLADSPVFSDVFRAICRETLPVIDRTSDDDESTHAPFESGLRVFVGACKLEIERHEAVRALLDVTAWRQSQRVH